MTFVSYPYRKYSLFLTHRDWCTVSGHTRGIHFADQISKKKLLMICYSSKVERLHILTLQIGNTCIEIFHGNGLAVAALSLGLPVVLNSHRFTRISPYGVYKWYILLSAFAHHFAGTCWKYTSRCCYSYTRHGYKCVDWTWIQMWYAPVYFECHHSTYSYF